MKQQSVFHLLSDITQKEGVSCILIGGFAVNFYKVTRQTADVDFLITKNDFDKVFRHLRSAGYEKDCEQENFVQLKSAKISLMNVDFMFVDTKTFQKMFKESRKIKIAKQEFLVPSLDHLIALKLHSVKYNEKMRLSRGLPDVINLMRANNMDVKDPAIKELCLKYATQEIYQKIAEAFK